MFFNEWMMYIYVESPNCLQSRSSYCESCNQVGGNVMASQVDHQHQSNIAEMQENIDKKVKESLVKQKETNVKEATDLLKV